MEHFVITTGAAAFIAGLTASPHCMVMCGPLGCAMLPVGQKDSSVQLATAAYHLTRAFAYLFWGGLAGLIGNQVNDWLELPLFKILPWVLVAFFLSIAFRLDRFLPRPAWTQRLHATIMGKMNRWPRFFSGAILGIATPFLPCGPLYAIFVVCLFTGSLLKGAEIALGFALGTIPLLWLAQSQFFRLQGKWRFRYLPLLQRVLALAAAVIIAFRLLNHSGSMDHMICF